MEVFVSMSEDIINRIMKAEDWDELELPDFILTNVEFLIDFGPFTKGEKYESIGIIYSKSKFEAYNNDGKVIKECSIKLIPNA